MAGWIRVRGWIFCMLASLILRGFNAVVQAIQPFKTCNLSGSDAICCIIIYSLLVFVVQIICFAARYKLMWHLRKRAIWMVTLTLHLSGRNNVVCMCNTKSKSFDFISSDIILDLSYM